jgi:hypothetical protein
MEQKNATLAGIMAGIACPATIGAPVRFRRLESSDMIRLRGDVLRVGKDFSTVITRERARKKEHGSPKSLA